MTLQQYRDDLILLTEAGFIAVNQSDEDSAIKLFKAAELIDPNNTLPKVGMGYIHLFKLELKQACKHFEDVLKKEPNNEMAKAFLGLSLSFSTKEVNKGEQLLEEAASKTKDPAIKNLASTAISFIEKFVKKPPSLSVLQSEEEKKRKGKTK